MNITMTEWEAKSEVLAAKLEARWPWLHAGHLFVQTPLLSAHAEIRSVHDDRKAYTIQITVDSSACVIGGALDIANAARMFAEIRDAMLFVHGETSDLTVWVDGECPCGYCSSRGTTQGRRCEKCDGAGKR